MKMHKRLVKFLNATNEGKEIDVERVLDMLNSENKAVRELILKYEDNYHFHQNMPEDFIKTAISEFIVDQWNGGWDVIERWYKGSKTLEKSLKELFNCNTWDFWVIEQAYSFLGKEMPYEEDTRDSGYEETNAWGT